MTDDPTTDLRFLSELVRRTDAAESHHIDGHDICGAVGIDVDQASTIVSRLKARGLVEPVGPQRPAAGLGHFNIRPTREAYSVVGLGLIAE
jgi:hypothetical protein